MRHWQVFGLMGQALACRLLDVASQACAQCVWHRSFPLTAAGQSRNSTGFPIATSPLAEEQNQLRQPLYMEITPM